jgi:hypothetical protein
MIGHALNLHSHHLLTQTGLGYLLDALEMIEPEIKMAVLAQDLTLFRNIKTLSRDLKNGSECIKEESFDWQTLEIDPRKFF